MKRMMIWIVLGGTLIGVVGWILSIVFEDPHVAHGRTLYTKYCSGCHGSKGYGDGFNAENLDPHPRDLTDEFEPYMAEGDNDMLFSAIKVGVSGVFPAAEEGESHVHDHGGSDEDDEAMGSSLMPYWGYTLSDEEIWSLVAFVRTLHSHDQPDVEFTEEISKSRKKPPRPRKEIDLPSIDSPEGMKLYQQGGYLYNERYACASCHRVGEEGGHVGPELDRAGFRLNPIWVYRWIIDAKGIKISTIMPSFGVSHREALAMTMYLSMFDGTGNEPLLDPVDPDMSPMEQMKQLGFGTDQEEKEKVHEDKEDGNNEH